MHRHFCSLWDRNYCEKGIVLHESLVRHSSEPFTLSVLCMDTPTHVILSELQLPNVELIPLSTFERALHLEPIRERRAWAEFCWGCASALIEYLLPWTDVEGVTYLDSDLFFLSDPACMFKELGSRSIAIVPHRLIPSKKHLEVNGLFNVGWVTIRNTESGRRCITRWAEQVRGWCHDRVEGARACGDQKYLDEWPQLYGAECCIIRNIGANLAPWNLANYVINLRDGEVFADDTRAVFFHAHEFKDPEHLTNYVLRPQDMLIYDRYIAAWLEAGERIRQIEAAREERQREMQLQSESA